jgi:hemerythrin-like domain-containing protein
MKIRREFMPVTIGAKPSPDFSNPIDLLSDCHRRIERFLAVLVEVVGQAKGRVLTGEQSRAWQNALDYFKNAAPRHTADEEESLFPRLRKIAQPEIQTALEEMQELEADHEQAGKWHEIVEQLGRKWLSEALLTPENVEELENALGNLSKLYRRHIALEDNSLFPVAAAVLGDTEKADVGSEMARRRGLDPKLSAGLTEELFPSTASRP